MTHTQGIIKFNEDRNLVKGLDMENEYSMLVEELNEELRAAIDTNDEHEQVDALCDIIVIATGALYKKGYHPELAMKQVVKEITSRNGKIGPTGKWEKDKNQDPDTLYKADYTLARRKVV